MNVRVQVALLVGVLVAVATAAASLGAYSASSAEAYDTVDDFLGERGAQAVLAVEGFIDRGPPPEGFDPPEEAPGPGLLGRFVEDDAIVSVQLPDGLADDIPGAFRTDPEIELPPPSTTGMDALVETVTIDGERYRLRTETSASGAVVQVARSLTETDSTLAAIRIRLLAIGVTVTVLAAGLGWLAARRLARPLEELSDAAERITATGDLATPLGTTAAAGEVGRVSRSFAEMLSVLEESRRRQRQLVADAGHELRTPLTTLRTNSELLASGRLAPDDEQRALASISAEVDELGELTAELVELAAETPTDRSAERVDAADVVRAAADRASRRHRREIAVDGRTAMVDGRPAQLDRAVSNLLDNAAKFSPDGSPIEVRVAPGVVEVVDDGPGIDPDDLPHVFDRFFRASRDRTLPGSGLGLAIVAKVAADHGGEAFARNCDAGTAVGFTFAGARRGPDDSPGPF